MPPLTADDEVTDRRQRDGGGDYQRVGDLDPIQAIPLQRFVPNGEIIVPVEASLDLAPQARKPRPSYKQIRVPRRDI
jgi:hypothetical protein